MRVRIPPLAPRKTTMKIRDKLSPSTKTYAGIGSRETPPQALTWMAWLGQKLERMDYTLRSGGAKGADSAFEKYVTQKEIYHPKDEIPDWCFTRIRDFVPSNYNFNGMKPYIQRLLARNMMQIWGRNGDNPVDFVICWTKDGKDTGGTGYAMRAAASVEIPIYNLYLEKDRLRLKTDILGYKK